MDLTKNLEKFIPNVLLSTAPSFIEFFKVYLEFLTSVSDMDPLTKIDIDTVPDQYLSNLKSEFARDIPLSNAVHELSTTEIRQLLKDSINLNKNKGTVNSIEFLFRVLFHSTIEVEFGRYGTYLEYKPLDYKIKIVDPITLEPIVGADYNKLSYQPFRVSNDQERVGFSTTYFKDYPTDTHHVWALESTRIMDGDLLFFYNTNTYALVETTNGLQLDGWLNEKERWKDEDDFYVLDEVNSRIDQVFFKEVNGFDKVYSTDVIEDSEDFRFYFSWTSGRLEIIQTDTPASTSVFTREIIGVKDGAQYKLNVQFSVTPTGLDGITINGVDKTTEFYTKQNSLVVPASQFFNTTGSPAVSETELYNIRNLIAAFSIFMKTDVSPLHYMEIIRKNVVPAGYRLIHINFIMTKMLGNIAQLAVPPSYKMKYGDSRSQCIIPPVTVDSIKYGDDWFDAFYRIEDLGNAQLFNFEPERIEYHQACTYSLSSHQTRVNITRTANTAVLMTPSFEEFMQTIGSTELQPWSTMLKIADFDNIKIDPYRNKYVKDPILFVVSPQTRVN